MVEKALWELWKSEGRNLYSEGILDSASLSKSV